MSISKLLKDGVITTHFAEEMRVRLDLMRNRDKFFYDFIDGKQLEGWKNITTYDDWFINCKKRTSRGGHLLDIKYPGWYRKINKYDIRMWNHSERCILGQLYNGRWNRGVIALNLSFGDPPKKTTFFYGEPSGPVTCVEYGFSTYSQLNEGECLEGAWISEVDDRIRKELL